MTIKDLKRLWRQLAKRAKSNNNGRWSTYRSPHQWCELDFEVMVGHFVGNSIFSFVDDFLIESITDFNWRQKSNGFWWLVWFKNSIWNDSCLKVRLTLCKDESDTGLQPGGRTVHRWGGMMTKTKIKTKTKTKTETETNTKTLDYSQGGELFIDGQGWKLIAMLYFFLISDFGLFWVGQLTRIMAKTKKAKKSDKNHDYQTGTSQPTKQIVEFVDIDDYLGQELFAKFSGNSGDRTKQFDGTQCQRGGEAE